MLVLSVASWVVVVGLGRPTVRDIIPILASGLLLDPRADTGSNT